MKTRLLLFASVLFMLWSCEDGLTADVDTTLESEVDVTTIADPGTTKAGTFVFYGEMVIDFEANPDLKEYINKLQDLKFNSAEVILTNIPEGAGVTYVDVYLVDYDITASFNNLFNGQASIWASADVDRLNSVTKEIITAKKVKIDYHGEATGEFTFKLKTRFPATVTTGL